MKHAVRRLWRITDWFERFVTVASPVMPLLMLYLGAWREAVAWAVAGLWWGRFLAQKIRNDQLITEIWLRELMHHSRIHALRRAAKKRAGQAHTRTEPSSSVHVPRSHRR